MKMICVDDDRPVLDKTVAMCRELPMITEVEGFESGPEALRWLEGHFADAAVLDIQMPEMDGITLASRIMREHPDTAVIFLTGYPEYAVDAFALHASGYMLKPAQSERLAAEVAYALGGRDGHTHAHISIQTFGNFDLMVDGKTVHFARSRAKELLAYLVDRQGSSITRAEAFAVLWEDEMYDRPMQKQLDVIIRSLRATLEEYGISGILEMNRGTLRVCPEMFDCDLYRFFEGDIDAVNAYRGEYMSSYSWASLTEAYMDRINRNL